MLYGGFHKLYHFIAKPKNCALTQESVHVSSHNNHSLEDNILTGHFTYLASPGDSFKRRGVETGVPFRREGGFASGRGTPAVCKEWSCIFRGQEDGRRVFVVLEAAPRWLDSGGGSSGKRAESGEVALREPFGGVGVDGARSFACVSSCSMRSSPSPQAEKRASSLRCSSLASLPCSFEWSSLTS